MKHPAAKTAAKALTLAAWAWAPVVLFFTSPILADPGLSPIHATEGDGLRLSAGALYALAGVLAIVGPGFWWAGRYDARVSTVEREMERIAKHLDAIASRSAAAGERIAHAVESIARGDRADRADRDRERGEL